MASASDYSFAGLENLWIKNGGNPEWAPTMAAVALGAESGGNPSATNPTSGAEGIWQILSSAQSAAFNKAHPPASMSDPNANARAAIALLGDGSGISNWSADPIGAAIVANGSKPLSPQQAQQYATNPPTNATLDSAVTTTDSSTPSVTLPKVSFAPPMQGVNVKNFMGSGIDLSAIPQEQLGNAENAVKEYVTDPGYAQQLQQRISQDFGYSGAWVQKIPELNGVLIWAASGAAGDPSTAAGKNAFQGAVANTQWWKTTDANQRSWEQVQSTDPAQAHQALQVAQDKVLATANQIGVQLTKQQLSSIANTYAAQTFVQSGSFGSQSGTSQEWLDQHVVDAVTAVKNGTSDLLAQGATATTTGNLTGIASQLYENFQQVAQQYLMYNPSNPGQSLLKQSDLMAQVNQALQSYTGTGASGQISQFEAGALNNFTEQMKQQASAMYPSLSGAIAQGTTPQQYTQPMANLISNTLGLDSSSIDFTSPQWNWAIATPDPKTNTKTALTQDQLLQKITDPNFRFTDPNGQQMSYLDTNSGQQLQNQFSQTFAAAFGRGA